MLEYYFPVFFTTQSQFRQFYQKSKKIDRNTLVNKMFLYKFAASIYFNNNDKYF